MRTHTLHKFIPIVFWVSVFLVQGMAGQSASSPERRADFSSVLGADKDSTHAKWEGDYLLTWQESGSPSQPSAHVTNQNGETVQDLIVWVRGAVWVRASDMTRTPSGRVYISGWAMNGGGARAGFLFAYNATGKLETVMRTAPYFPNNICAIDDDSVWVSGNGSNEEDFGMLREYNIPGGLKTDLVPRNTITTGERQLDHAYRGSLTCDANRLVLYLPEFSRVVEYKQSGSQPPRVYQFSKIAQGLIPTGFAMTRAGKLYAAITGQGDKVAAAGVFELKLNADGAATWTPVSELQIPKGYVGLLGAQENQLVYHLRRTGSELHWAAAGMVP